MTRVQTQQALRQLPVKWALALLGLIVVYALAQPALNSRLGWNLPSLARLMGEPEPKKKANPEKANPEKANPEKANSKEKSTEGHAKESEPQASPSKEGKPRKGTANNAALVDEAASEAEGSAENSTSKESGSLVATQEPPAQNKSSSSKNSSPKNASTKNPPANQTKADSPAEPKTKAAADDSSLLYGILKEVGRDRYVSIEGLQYNPGSEEGHRLKHLERHLQDMPNRPGKHGVFDGEMKDALKWIDDAYARGKRGAKGIRKTEEDNRTVYEVPFNQPIGYIGGQDGKRSGNPPAKRLRLVVEGSKFVTAFPF